MRHWPALVTTLALAAACTPPAAPPVATPSPEATATPAPTMAPTATPSPSPSPSLAASPTPTASASVEQLETLEEANHGPEPFPAAPTTNALDLRSATVVAGANNATARGAIDAKPYTQWAARQGVASNVWYTVDLGSPTRISRVDLLADASPEADVFYNVDVSADYQTWKLVGSGRGTGSNAEPTWATALFAPETARYVRIVPTNWGTSWVGVWELRISP